jgi:hypothetical protein
MCAIAIPVLVLHSGIAGRAMHDSDLLRVGGPLSLVRSGALAIRVDKRAVSQPHIFVPSPASERPGKKAEGRNVRLGRSQDWTGIGVEESLGRCKLTASQSDVWGPNSITAYDMKVQ